MSKLTFIEASAVPTSPIRYTPYADMLKRIKKGKALVVSDDELSVDTVRAGIRRLQKSGRFKKLVVRSVKGEDGIRRLYVVNPMDEEPLAVEPEE